MNHGSPVGSDGSIPGPSVWSEWHADAVARAPVGWPELIEELRRLQDVVAGTVPTAEAVERARAAVVAATEALAPYDAGDDAIFGRLIDRPDRGQSFAPVEQIERTSAQELVATTVLGRFHAGSFGVAHGGAIAVLFDDLLGLTADLGGRPRSRTAYLHVDYRSVTPLDRVLTVRVRFERQEGRKRFLRGTLHDGDRLCAEAEGLYVELLPGQR